MSVERPHGANLTALDCIRVSFALGSRENYDHTWYNWLDIQRARPPALVKRQFWVGSDERSTGSVLGSSSEERTVADLGLVSGRLVELLQQAQSKGCGKVMRSLPGQEHME